VRSTQVSRDQSAASAGAAPGLLPHHSARGEGLGPAAGGLQQRARLLGGHQLGHFSRLRLPVVPQCSAGNPLHALFPGNLKERRRMFFFKEESLIHVSRLAFRASARLRAVLVRSVRLLY